MTLGEFKAWLDGYLTAGGNDLTVIKGKLDETREPPAYFSPGIPTYNPMHPSTGRYPGDILPFNTCSNAEVGNKTVAVS